MAGRARLSRSHAHGLRRLATLRVGPFVLAYDTVTGVSLDRPETGAADQLEQIGTTHLVGCAEAVGVVRDLVLDDGAVQVVSAERKRELRRREAVHDPEALHVLD